MAETLPKRPPITQGRTRPAAVPDAPEPPGHLGEESAGHWRDATEGWVLGADALPVLLVACETFDRYRAAADQIQRDGPTVVHPGTGAVTTHPAWQVCRDSLREWRQLWRQLGLTPPEDSGGAFA